MISSRGVPLIPSAYQHIHLGGEDYFPEVEELGHEHLIFTTAPYQLTVKDLDSIVDAVPSLDRENETVRVLQITPGIIKQLRNNSSDSYSFNMSHPLPEVVVLLGGKDLSRPLCQGEYQVPGRRDLKFSNTSGEGERDVTNIDCL